MSQEVWLGEVDSRRFDRLENVLERIASKLEEAVNSTSNNTDSLKLPSWNTVEYECRVPSWPTDTKETELKRAMARRVYDFIAQQLQASA